MRIHTILYFITYTFIACYIVKNIFSLFCRSSINTLYLYFIKQTVLKLKTMKTISEIRIEAIRVINNVITLKANATNGCYTDKSALEVAEARLSGIKSWAIANDQMPEIRNYFASHNFGQNNQFAASEVASFFNN